MSDGTDLSQIQETPQKLDAPQEVQAVAEARQDLDRAAFQPQETVEFKGDVALAEQTEKEFVAAIDATTTLSQAAASPIAEEGRPGAEVAAGAAADREPGTGNQVEGSASPGEPTEDSLPPDAELTSSDISPGAPRTPGGTDSQRQLDAQRLIQGQGGNTQILGSVGSDQDTIARGSLEEVVVQSEGSPRP